ncbi:hypothetical protein A2U01_0060572, partial [Trifolium medium]|nr:hypothetical protein [Trifolium medium]
GCVARRVMLHCARPCAVMYVRLLRLALRARVSLRGVQCMFVFLPVLLVAALRAGL